MKLNGSEAAPGLTHRQRLAGLREPPPAGQATEAKDVNEFASGQKDTADQGLGAPAMGDAEMESAAMWGLSPGEVRFAVGVLCVAVVVILGAGAAVMGGGLLRADRPVAAAEDARSAAESSTSGEDHGRELGADPELGTGTVGVPAKADVAVPQAPNGVLDPRGRLVREGVIVSGNLDGLDEATLRTAATIVEAVHKAQMGERAPTR